MRRRELPENSACTAMLSAGEYLPCPPGDDFGDAEDGDAEDGEEGVGEEEEEGEGEGEGEGPPG